MLFNSLEFIYFFIVVLLVYHLSPRKFQNILLLVASYFFYGTWNYKLLPLILVTTIINYYCSRKMHGSNTSSQRKYYLYACLAVNLGILGYFKYMNFFIGSFNDLVSLVGINDSVSTLQIILPVGISFYTFQVSSYSIDVYRKRLNPSNNYLEFSVFIAFFPQLVAGPIERAQNLLHQFSKKRTVTSQTLSSGCYLLLLGYFKKIFVADNLAIFSDQVFSESSTVVGVGVLIGLLAFTFQIYCDFSGYTDIARGAARLLGFELMENFKFPYFSRSPREFWSRWHISLSSWLRDYLYFPLGGSRVSKLVTYRNLLITMLLGGLWHGANWTFIVWGAFHGSILILYRLLGIEDYLRTISSSSITNIFKNLLFWLLFFGLTVFGWGIFRAESLLEFVVLLSKFSFDTYDGWQADLLYCLIYTTPLIIIECVQYAKLVGIIQLKAPYIFRSLLYTVLFYLIIIYGAYGGKEFIYFQF